MRSNNTFILISILIIIVGLADSLSLSGFHSQTYQFEGTAGGVFNLVTDVDFHLNARLEGPKVRSFPPRIVQLGFRVASDQILVGVDPDTGQLSVRLHDDEIHDMLTIKLAGGSMRRHGERLVLRLDKYYVKVSKRAEGTLAVEIRYYPNRWSTPHGIIGQSVWPSKARYAAQSMPAPMPIEGVAEDYRIRDGDIFSTRSRFSNFSVTDLWNQEFRMFRERRSISENNGWRTASVQ